MGTVFKILSFIGIACIAALVFTSDLPQLIMQGDAEGLRKSANDRMWEMLLITFLVMLLQNLVTAVPLILLATVNAALFGFMNGYIWSWLSSVTAATIVFLLTRYWLQDWLMNKVNATLKERIERNGFIYVLICRLIPIMPSSLINMASGASTIRFTHFVLSTLIGNLLFMAALAAVTLGIMTAGWEVAVLSILALATVGGLFYMRRRRRNAVSGGRGRSVQELEQQETRM